MKLDEQRFLSVIEASPLVSIDLVIKNHRDEILLGERQNRPAQGYWFVPGGRIQKNETIAEAFDRLTKVELGQSFSLAQARCLGPYDHIYRDNFKGKEGIGTHYVAIAYELRITEQDMQELVLDDQHSSQAWWGIQDLLASDLVHANTKAYFDDRFRYGAEAQAPVL